MEAIVPEMLSQEEIKLLNDYHAKVYETLSPMFNEEERQWLESATRAI
ncbi:MAG: M24 family metallopeptidase C-terminal domain-containing protein [Oscillospiraceae bacterium]|nr:M24 family metallopeptidase C-terminal domain-containing protein [Oscillospiraceae bacterium]